MHDFELLPNGDIRLNPKAYCPLTLYDTSMNIVQKIQRFFELSSGRDPKENLKLLFLCQTIGIREIDALVKGENCRISEYNIKLSPIFEHHLKDKTPLFNLSKKFTPELIDLYFQELRYNNYVRIINANHRLRTPYEKLVQYGFAITGLDIPLTLSATTIGRDGLYEICRQFKIKGKRKNIDTSELLCRKQEIRNILKQRIDFSSCFMIKKIQGLDVATPCYDYTSALAEIFFIVYASYHYRAREIEQAEYAYRTKSIEGLQYHAIECDLCECKALHGKVFTPAVARTVIFKPRCRCYFLPYNSRWHRCK